MALVLTRKVGESLIVGDDTKITIVELRNGQVRLAIDAPRNIAVHREEVYDRIKKSQEA